MSLSGFPEVKWIYIRSFGIVDSPEYKELVVPTPLLIQPDRQGFSYANPADRNRSPNAELSNHNFEFTEATTIRIFLTLRSVEEKSTDSTVRECKKK